MKSLVFISLSIFIFSCSQDEIETTNRKLGEEESNSGDSLLLIDEPEVVHTESIDSSLRTSNGLLYTIEHDNPEGNLVKSGDVLRMTYKLLAPDGEIIKSSEIAGDNYSIVQGASFVPEVLDQALIDFKEGVRISLQVPALHPQMEQFKPGLFVQEDTLIYQVEIKEIVPAQNLDGGVTLHVVKKGSGIKVTPGDKIGVDFFGFLENGEAFISSRQVSPEFECIVGKECVVPGLDIAFQNMRISDKAYVKIPSKMAYGEKGHSTIVPPNSNLIYFVTIDYQK